MRAPLTRPSYWIVSGNIGTGKSTLLRMLEQVLELRASLERSNENPFLAHANSNALAAELYFLLTTVGAERESAASDGGLLERCADEHVDVFAKGRLILGQLSGEEWQLLHDVRRNTQSVDREPDLLIYLAADRPTLERRVRERNAIGDPDVPSLLDVTTELYDTFIRGWHRCPVLHVDTTIVDVRDRTDVERLVHRGRALAGSS